MAIRKPINDTLTKSETAGPDTHDMVVVHRIFRWELRMLPDLVRATPEDGAARAGRAQPEAELVRRVRGQASPDV